MNHKRLSERLEERLSKEVIFHISLAQLLVFIAIATYTIVFSYFSILKYTAFRAFGQDLGIFSQSFWTALHGMFFYSTPDQFWNPSGFFFGEHFTPLMYLILPIYAIFSQPQTLLVLQSFILGLAAMPLFWISRHELKSNTLALTIALIYLLNPWMHAVNLYDFHLEAFLPAFFLFAFFFFLTHKWIKYFVFILLAMITIEYGNLFAIGFGIYWLVIFRKTIIGKLTYRISVLLKKPHKKETLLKEEESSKPIFMALITIISAILIFTIGLKMISVYGPTPLTTGSTGPLWPTLGNKFNEIVLSLFNPIKVFTALSIDAGTKILYVFALFALVGFLPILAPIELILTLPWFIISLLSENSPFYFFGWHYCANIVPFLFIATIYGNKRLKMIVQPRDFSKIFSSLLVIIIILSVILTPVNPITWNKIWGGAYDNKNLSEHEALMERIIKFIPSNSSILTQNNFFPHLSNRVDIFLWYPPIAPDYVLYDFKSPDLRDTFGSITSAEIISETLNSSNYGLLASADGIVLVERGYLGSPIFYQPFSTIYDHKNLAIGVGGPLADPSSISGIVLLHPSVSAADSTFWFGPYVTLGPGRYQATFILKVNTTDVGYLMTLDAVAQGSNRTLAEQQVYGHDFIKPLTWTNITISFYVDQIYTDLEFRGIKVSNLTNIYLDLIEIQEIPKQ